MGKFSSRNENKKCINRKRNKESVKKKCHFDVLLKYRYISIFKKQTKNDSGNKKSSGKKSEGRGKIDTSVSNL